MTPFPPSPRTVPINVVALGVAASATLVVLYVLCWVVAVVFPGLALSHGWLNLFTTAPITSVAALIEGVIWSIVFGWVIALVLAPIYNKLTSG
jgi:hypothetical protein